MFRAGDKAALLKLARDVMATALAPKLDFISFISDRDRNAEKTWWRLRTRPYVFPNTFIGHSVADSEEVRLVFTGDGDYLPNREALLFALKVIDTLPQPFTLELIGRGFEDFTHPRLKKLGYVQDGELFRARDIHIAPAFSGAGIKTKVCHPAALGLQVVTNREGAEGLRALPNVHIVSTVRGFADKVIEISTQLAVAPERETPQSVFVIDESSALKTALLAGTARKS